MMYLRPWPVKLYCFAASLLDYNFKCRHCVLTDLNNVMIHIKKYKIMHTHIQMLTDMLPRCDFIIVYCFDHGEHI